MESAVKKAFQHVLYLHVGDGGKGRAEREIRIEREGTESALDGMIVWQHLVDRGKAFAAGTFDAAALLHNLTDEDYGRPLDELRDSFWSSPRLPLLPGGEDDLRSAVYAAVVTDQIMVVDDQGEKREVFAAGEVALNQPSLRLRRIVPVPAPEPGGDDPGGADADPAPSPSPEETDVIVAFTIRTGLRDQDRIYAVAQVLQTLATDVDSDAGASHIDLTVKVTMPRADAQALVAHAKDAGASPVLTEL